MSRRQRVEAFLIVCFTFISASTLARNPLGELAVSGGVLYLQGAYPDFPKSGPSIMIRADMHLRPAPIFAAVANANLMIFTTEDPVTVLYFGNPTRGYLTQTGTSVQFGLQMESTGRATLIRLRAAMLSSIYFVNYLWQLRTPYQETEETSRMRIRFGWRLDAGVDFYPFGRIGLCFDFLFDQINGLQSGWRQDSQGNWNLTSSPVRFHSYVVGIVIPFEQFCSTKK